MDSLQRQSKKVVDQMIDDDAITADNDDLFNPIPPTQVSAGKTALHLAAEAGEVPGVRQLLFPPPTPSCTPNQNNANALHHYVLQVRRPSAQLGEGTRTRIEFGGKSFVFQGPSVFFHRELPEVLPKMPVSRWTNKYEFHFEKAPMIDRQSKKVVDQMIDDDAITADNDDLFNPVSEVP
ncbi:unnamed protein product [Cylicocyclus nassatus]|uniref:ANK_REP_REGION domain-containing protein n=1 Tax=Cylicocyclus nassatus TaxID=53992 RepID=A0AA36H6C8_CYLNA|nr:unnamed protein product [Cylicocyclus nassatus]